MTGVWAAAAAIALAAIGYFGIRWAEERERIDNILVAVLGTELPPTCHCTCCEDDNT